MPQDPHKRQMVPSDPPSFIDHISQAQITPLSHYTPPRFDATAKRMVNGEFDGGLYDATGQLCPTGENKYLTHTHCPAPQVDPGAATQELSGRYLYAGMVQNNHFGHFLTESTSRLWGLDHCEDIDGILCQNFYPNQPLSGFATEIFDILAPGIPSIPITQQTRVETLLLPQALRFPRGTINGHPLNRSLFTQAAAQLPEPSAPTPNKIFVSRAGLPLAGARFVLEEALDANFAAHGYTVIHPETLSVAEQMRIYAGASHLVFSEGSALHLYALVARPEQKTFFIWRRQVMHPIFNQQLTSFGGAPLLGQNHVLAMLPHVKFPDAPARASSLLDFAALGQDLADQGFIDRDDPWPCPTPKILARGLKRLRKFFDISAAQATLPPQPRRFFLF